MAINTVVKTNTLPRKGFIPEMNMWWAQTMKLRKEIAIRDPIMARLPVARTKRQAVAVLVARDRNAAAGGNDQRIMFEPPADRLETEHGERLWRGDDAPETGAVGGYRPALGGAYIAKPIRYQRFLEVVGSFV